MDIRRLMLFLVFIFSLMVLWGEWTRQNHVQHQTTSAAAEQKPNLLTAPPVVRSSIEDSTPKTTPLVSTTPSGKLIRVVTDTLAVEINTAGANIERLELLQHKQSADKSKPIVLMQRQGAQVYLAQSGLLGNGLPTHNAMYEASSYEYSLQPGQDSLQVVLTASANKAVTKTYTFHRNSYLVEVGYDVKNNGKEPIAASAYFQLVRDSIPPEGESSFVPTYTGPVIYTDQEKFQKIGFTDIEKNKVNLPKSPDNGWVGMLQHYFVSAWLPQGKTPREFYARQLEGKLFSAGVILPMAEIGPEQTTTVSVPLYVGPAQTKLDEIAPGLGLTVDYGLFTVFAAPLFWIMAFINEWVGNWGVSIILLTVLIKLAFFPLSAASYRSMAKMRVIAPKLERIKQQYGEDRERLNKAMMELYKTEKINPLGGCLPVLIQIPVFIGLYWAILESVELRHAPFVGWITDLSATDPYFVLPILMGASMIIQTRLNPTPTDPMQAKIMQIMPIAFSVFFFFFPAGLVLYSVVNNILSIAQQWYINRGAETARQGGARI